MEQKEQKDRPEIVFELTTDDIAQDKQAEHEAAELYSQLVEHAKLAHLYIKDMNSAVTAFQTAMKDFPHSFNAFLDEEIQRDVEAAEESRRARKAIKALSKRKRDDAEDEAPKKCALCTAGTGEVYHQAEQKLVCYKCLATKLQAPPAPAPSKDSKSEKSEQ